MWSASGTPKAAPAAVTTPQMTLIGIGGEDHWHLHRPQLLQALGGCARQIFAGELIYPRPASSEGDLATAAKDAELAARIRCNNWRGGLIPPPADDGTPEGRQQNEARYAVQGYRPTRGLVAARDLALATLAATRRDLEMRTPG